MKIVHYADTGSEVQQNGPRQGRFEFKRLLEGKVGSPDNFIFRITRLGSDFYSPRHCHNFDQIRYILKGTTDFSKDGKLKAGMIGYFPEGTAYGPQTMDDDMLIMILQFGGASGQGYLSADQLEDAGGELKTTGRFEKGMYITIDANGKEHSKDAYQAIWEHINGVPFRATARRYTHPIMIDPEHFTWRTSPTEPNVAKRPLGRFSECETQLDMYRVGAGATVRLDEHSIYFVKSGAGTTPEGDVSLYSAMQLDFAEYATFTASEDTLLLHIGLPDLRAFTLPTMRELATAGR